MDEENPPNDDVLLRFVAGFVGWTRIDLQPDEACYYGCPANGLRSDRQIPDYLNDLNAWHKDVWSKIDRDGLSSRWLQYLEGWCGKWVISWVNATAWARCLALWYMFDGVLPKETKDATRTGSASTSSNQAGSEPAADTETPA